MAAASGTAVLALKSLGWRSFDDHEIVLALSAIEIRTISDPIWSFFAERRHSRWQKFSHGIEGILRAAFLVITEKRTIEWQTLGINAFLVRRHFPRFWELHLDRVANVRIRQVGRSRVVWTKGKGVIGQCWVEQADVGRNFAVDYAGLLDCTETRWLALPAEFRQGLDYSEFRATRHHRTVVAMPIVTEGGRFLGVVSIDAPGDVYELLMKPEARRELRDAAFLIARVVS